MTGISKQTLIPPAFTLSPVMMHGAEAADFLERHYWLKKHNISFEPGCEVDCIPEARIRDMIEMIRDFDSCRRFVLWGVQDNNEQGLIVSHTIPHTGYLDWGNSPNDEPGANFWCENDQDIYGQFYLDLYPDFWAEKRTWDDPNDPYNNKYLHDGFFEGEYKVVLFDWDTWLDAYDNDDDGIPDMAIMRPRVFDDSGNWTRAGNIRDIGIPDDCDGLELILWEPFGRNEKQFINLDKYEELPDGVAYIPDNERDRMFDVTVKIYIDPENPRGIPHGAKVRFTWSDPDIPEAPFLTSNPPGSISRPEFPWIDTSNGGDTHYLCNDSSNIFYPIIDPTLKLFPDPQVGGNDNSDSNLSAFHDLNSEICRYRSPLEQMVYVPPGFQLPEAHITSYIVDLNIDPIVCSTEVATTFYTSNFGGDNYIIKVELFEPDAIPGQDAPCLEVETSEIVVWRKVYVQISDMRNRTLGWLCHPFTSSRYWHWSGPYSVSGVVPFLNKTFDDCFIHVEELMEFHENTVHRDEIDPRVWPYAHAHSSFHANNNPHAINMLFVDSYVNGMCPEQPHFSAQIGSTSLNDERDHVSIGVGAIADVFHTNRYPYIIDGIAIHDINSISKYVALHELGHSLGFSDPAGNSAGELNGHISGPGTMWSMATECQYKHLRSSYFWGDHVFVLRLDPVIP